MILRAAAVGFLLWLLTSAALRFFGQMVLAPTTAPAPLIVFLSPLIMAGLAFVAIRLISAARGDEAEAAIALAFPGLILDAFAALSFANAYPNLDAGLDGAFAAMRLGGYAAIIFVGLLLTRIAPSDERV